MNINTLLGNIKTALKADSSLEEWCQDNYGKSPIIYNGINPEDLPGIDDYPLIVLRQSGKKGGKSAEFESLEIVMICGLFDEDVVNDFNDDKICTGEINIEVMRQLAMSAASTSDMDSGFIAGFETAVDPDEQHPVYLIGTIFTVERPYAFRENRLE